MVPARYMARIADGVLAEALTTSGAVQVKGPKWCGKTATSLQQAASVVYLQDPDRSASYLALADAKPSALLEGRTPRLIDEWQMAPQLWDAVRFAVDLRGEPGQFVLTGSSTPAVGGAHSGVGRIAPMVMRTMTLFEGLIDSDVARMDGVSRNSTRMRALMRAYARHVSTQASQTTIATDLAVNDGAMAPNTVSDYLDALSRAYVVEDLPAWNPVLRSKTAIRTSPTRHFVDPSIGVAVMRWTPADLLRDFEAFGLQFESLCVRDLRVYAEAIDGTLLHYRDKTGLEADAVIVLADGRWAPIEVKLGSRQLDEAAAHLRRLCERVDADRMGEPSFLAVVTAGGTAYRRDDGVLVVPLACLRP